MSSSPEDCWIDCQGFAALQVKEEIAGTRGTINGVPHFTINGQYQLSGAQDPSAFVKIFNKF
jgi:predicted DsbA family dithiol-disulfide isomerase